MGKDELDRFPPIGSDHGLDVLLNLRRIKIDLCSEASQFRLWAPLHGRDGLVGKVRKSPITREACGPLAKVGGDERVAVVCVGKQHAYQALVECPPLAVARRPPPLEPDDALDRVKLAYVTVARTLQQAVDLTQITISNKSLQQAHYDPGFLVRLLEAPLGCLEHGFLHLGRAGRPGELAYAESAQQCFDRIELRWFGSGPVLQVCVYCTGCVLSDVPMAALEQQIV